MRTGAIVAIAVAVVGVTVASLGFGVPAYQAREQRAAAENQKLLMVAIKEKDLASVTILAKRRVDIYATDKTGESALSLAEQSGDQRILEALGPRRDSATDFARVQRAAELGYSVGLQPPRREPEFNVDNFIRDLTARALAEKQPAPSPDELADLTGRAIAALPEGNRKQWALRNLTINLYSAGRLSRAQDLAMQLDDPKMRGDMLIGILTHSTGTAQIESRYAFAKSEIDKMEDPSVRDPLQAQLAHFAGLRAPPAEKRKGAISEHLQIAGATPQNAPQLQIASPPPQIVASAAPPQTLDVLQGTWIAGNLARNGKLHLDNELMSTTWIFRESDLYIYSELPQRRARQFTVKLDPGARPNTIRLTSSLPTDRDGWMIFLREGADLKIAFYQDFSRQPAGFDTQDDLIVVGLTPNTGKISAADDGCGLLWAAGAYDLIGIGSGQQRSRKYEKGGFECRIWRDHDVHLRVYPAPESLFDQRAGYKRSPMYEFKFETGLGARAYSLRHENNLSFVAYKDGNFVVFMFAGRGADPDAERLRQVFQRVLDRI